MKKNKKVVPKRRFKEFENDGEWEQHKLKDVVRFSKGRGYAKKDLAESGTPIILYGRLYTKFETVINEVDTFAKAKENTVYSTGTEVIVPSSGETAEDIARAAAVRKEGVILGGDLNIMHLVESKDPVFLALSISNGTRKKELIKRAQGSSVVHLYNTDLEEAEVFFPKIEEQKKISSFFNHNDNLINLQKNKIEKSKKLKESYLSDMFPKEGEKYPKKRFEGFTEPWKECMLRDLGDIITGSTPSTENSFYYSDEGIPWVTPTDISDNITYDSTRYLSAEGQKVACVAPKDTILITSIASIGKNTILGTKGSFNQQINALVPNKTENDAYFLFIQSIIWSEQMKNTAASGTMQIVNKTQFSEIKAFVPPLDEQIKIGNFFKNLDAQIDLEEQKLSKLEQLKEAYLNELFV